MQDFRTNAGQISRAQATKLSFAAESLRAVRRSCPAFAAAMQASLSSALARPIHPRTAEQTRTATARSTRLTRSRITPTGRRSKALGLEPLVAFGVDRVRRVAGGTRRPRAWAI